MKDENEILTEPKLKEYIFLIDRSGSKSDTIRLAHQTLKLFIQSLPFGSKFQIVSYGSKYEFLFKDRRSVEYTAETFQQAFDKVSEFEANFSGTDIFSPLQAIYALPKPNKD